MSRRGEVTDRGTKLPGKPRNADEALSEWRTERSKYLARVPPENRILFWFLCGGEDDQQRWRVRLDCGHVRELIAPRTDPPTKWEWEWKALLPGECACTERGCLREAVSDIVSWDERTAVWTQLPDPVEPPQPIVTVLGDKAAGYWARKRHREPRRDCAEWQVTLSCGHTATTEVLEPGWLPANGYRRDAPYTKEQARRISELLAEPDVTECTKRAARERFPRPLPWMTCPTCYWARKITGYEYIGPLVRPRDELPRPPEVQRAELERKLAAAERTAERLRQKLAGLPELAQERGRA